MAPSKKRLRGVSLRTKILVILTLLPAITLAIFLFMALGIFEKDKIAYVYDSTSTVARSTAAQVTSELNLTLMSVRPVMQEYLTVGSFAAISNSFMESTNNVDAVAVYQSAGNSVELKTIVEKKNGAGSAALAQIKDWPNLVYDAYNKHRILRSPFGDGRLLLLERFDGRNGVLYFAIISRLKNISDTISAPGSSNIFWVDENSHVLISSELSHGENLSERYNMDFFSELKNQKFSSGTKEIHTSDKTIWLASFSRVFGVDGYVFSLVPKNEALKAVKLLLRKSLVLFLLLISGTIIVSLIASGSLTSALSDLRNATKMVSEGQFEFNVMVKSRDEIGDLADSFNAMTAEISRLLLATAEKARMESELKTAQTVQETLFPANEADLPGLRIAGYYEPASECGGDWWHYYQVGSKVFLWIGDATGHGAPAALITSAAKSAATLIEKFEENNHMSPSRALELLNRAIYDVSRGKIMMTFFLACYDSKSKTFSYANASHESPYLIKQKNTKPKKKDFIPLNEVNNPRLGQDRSTEFDETEIVLEPGDRIFFYTDGLPDIQNPDKQAWGEREFLKNLVEVVSDYPPAHESIYRMRESLILHRKRAPLIDDVTFFMVEVPSEGAAQHVSA